MLCKCNFYRKKHDSAYLAHDLNVAMSFSTRKPSTNYWGSSSNNEEGRPDFLTTVFVADIADLNNYASKMTSYLRDDRAEHDPAEIYYVVPNTDHIRLKRLLFFQYVIMHFM